MHPNSPLRVPAVLDVYPFSEPPGDLAWVRCVNCSESLTLHQPDLDSPDQLLGVCGACKRWVLIELVPDQPEAVMVPLPKKGWGVAASKSLQLDPAGGQAAGTG